MILLLELFKFSVYPDSVFNRITTLQRNSNSICEICRNEVIRSVTIEENMVKLDTNKGNFDVLVYYGTSFVANRSVIEARLVNTSKMIFDLDVWFDFLLSVDEVSISTIEKFLN